MEKVPSMEDEFLVAVNHIIEKNIDNENFSVEELAKEVGFSRSMLHRKLIKLIGKSAGDLITEKRLAIAKELLLNDVATASEIAYRVGFKNPSYFNKVFKKHFNQSPGEVRKESKINTILTNDSQQKKKGQKSSLLISVLNNKYVFLTLILIALVVIIFFFSNLFVSKEKSIAVLPLNNLTGQADKEYIANIMHDELIGELGKLNNLRVISRTSTLKYQDSITSLENIAEELDVDLVVEASLVRADDGIGILLKVVDVFPRERNILTMGYDYDMKNFMQIYSSAAKDIATKLKIDLSQNELQRFSSVRTVNPETRDAYMRGMYNISLGTTEKFEKGINYLLEAIEKDPADPYAYAGLALAYANVGHGQMNPQEAFDRAIYCANTAIELDASIDEAYTAKAMLYLYDSWEWDKAKEAFEDAIMKNQNNDLAHAHFAWYYVLLNDLEKAEYHGEISTKINPLSVAWNAWLALIYYHNGQYMEAEEYAQKALSLNKDVPYANLTMGWLNLKEGDFEKAFEYFEKLPKTDYLNMYLVDAYVKAGQREKAMAIWNEMEEKAQNKNVNPAIRGLNAAALGFYDRAFEYLNDACDKKLYPVNYINFFPNSESIRSDPRYNDLLRKLNLPTIETSLADSNYPQ